ncbi:phage major capsid protein [Mycolicibacterium smegmatis]|uniref:Phage capsid family protein n=1 Tax=Mycolicibacterium smegmatis (strain MKD8) TaxID=1214915 RepID=A0A2U9PQ61_MYCSE|nr:phage major capsid protein [Mycolicibacterium smegmatis]AWT53857.1 Phage capsid family protein [Mycolicibacterium smegmatis MKD8]
MAVTNSGLQTGWTPEDYGKLLDLVIAEKSIAFKAGTVISTGNESVRFPMLTADPAVGWYAENTQISLTDPTTDELVITPKAVKGLTQISNEAASDTNPAVADQVARALARSIAKKIDAAFFANTTTNGPAGLLSLTGINVVDTGTIPFTSLDPFHEAKAAALADGANLSVFILAPDVALALSKAKIFTPGETSDATSNVGLLDVNGVGDGTTLAGVPVLVSTDVASGNAWGLDSEQVLIVQRTGTQITRSTDAAFAYDAVQVRGTARVSWGFSNPAGVVRLYDAA